MRAGRTFVTHGPLMNFAVDGQIPGGDVQLANEQPTIIVHAEVHSPIPFETLEIICNGERAAQAPSGVRKLLPGSPLEPGSFPSHGGWVIAGMWGPQLAISGVYFTGLCAGPRQDASATARNTAKTANYLADLCRQAQNRQSVNSAWCRSCKVRAKLLVKAFTNQVPNN